MNRKHLSGALLLASASLLATGAYAQNPHAAADGKEHAADKAQKAADKADKAGDKAEKAAAKAEKAADKVAKAGEKADKAADKAEDKAKAADERAARKTKQHEAQRAKLAAMLKGPMDDAIRQELRRHAERLARLERVKSVADAQKDSDTADRANKLIQKENERHDKWMSKHASPVATGGAK